MLGNDLATVFEGIKDKRSVRNQKHPFLSLLGIAELTRI